MPVPDHIVACFSVHAAVEPGVMPRVLETIAKRGLVPTRWHSAVVPRVAGPGRPALGEELAIDIELAGADRRLAELLAAAMRQVAEVELVLTTEKRAALSA